MKKVLFPFAFLFALTLFAEKNPPTDWYHQDMKKDKYPGIGSKRAHDELLKGKQAKDIVVAVIDGGTDVNHEDLKDIIWINTREVAGNGIDDDHNGYIDDINGWSFIGGKDSDVVEDTYELTRMYDIMRKQYAEADTSKLDQSQKKAYYQYLEIAGEFQQKQSQSKNLSSLMQQLEKAMNQVAEKIGNPSPTLKDIKKFEPGDKTEAFAKKNLLRMMDKGLTWEEIKKQLKDGYDYYSKGALYSYNTSFNSRTRIGDDPDNLRQCCYGNNHVSGPKGEHGTHVAGIIGAVRNNAKGIDGVADHVRIMVLRVVPDGDERDKDVANAIRYAADNGAKVINMSFGKSYSPYKSVVDEAVRYAESKDVLIVHAAGNDSKNTDEGNNFPRDVYEDGTIATNWIEVGASSWKKRKYLSADFSNYGKTNVDVFAPGVAIYSTLPGNTYGSYNGTSMAAPVTAGVAALIRAYYPSFTAAQVKSIICDSAIPVKKKVVIPGTKKEKAKLNELSTTGGLVNAYEALLLAGRRAQTTARR